MCNRYRQKQSLVVNGAPLEIADQIQELPRQRQDAWPAIASGGVGSASSAHVAPTRSAPTMAAVPVPARPHKPIGPLQFAAPSLTPSVMPVRPSSSSPSPTMANATLFMRQRPSKTALTGSDGLS